MISLVFSPDLFSELLANSPSFSCAVSEGLVGFIISLLDCASRRDAEGVDNNIFLAICESKDGFIARCGAVGQHNRIRKIGGHTEGRNRPILDEDHHSLMRRGVDDEEVLVLKGAIEFQLTALITRDRCPDCHNGDNEKESRNHLTRLKISDRESSVTRDAVKVWVANTQKVERRLTRGSLDRLVRRTSVGIHEVLPVETSVILMLRIFSILLASN